MKYYIFESHIGHNEETQKLFEFLGNEGDLTIGINSSGGSGSVAQLLLKALNQNKDRVTLCCLAGVYSSAFYVFAEYEGQKTLTVNTKGMWHYGTWDISIDDRNQPACHEGVAIKKDLKFSKEFMEKIARKYMNEKELKKFKKGEDVFFGYERMRELFPNAEIL